MAQLLTPVCADPFKLQNKVRQFNDTYSSINRWSFYRTRHHKRRVIGQTIQRDSARVKAVVDDSIGVVDDFADDYYAVLGLTPDASPQQIRKAYYNCMKACHPDLSGDDPEATNFCKFINEVYGVLSDPVQRKVYDEIHGYSLTAINPFMDDSSPRDHVFVDEFSCIGCKNCANVASDVFRIEEDFGRARVYKQCGVSDNVQQAIESCPVDCIHLTSAAQLSLLEDEMRRVERVNVALMLAGMGVSSDVFRMAYSRWEKRQSKILEKAKFSLMKQNGADGVESYWDNLWGKLEYQSSEEEVQEREKRAAEAARRWSEYSRKRADKRSTYKLPDAVDVSKD